MSIPKIVFLLCLFVLFAGALILFQKVNTSTAEGGWRAPMQTEQQWSTFHKEDR